MFSSVDYRDRLAQSAGVILTQSNCCLENSFRIHFLDAYGVPGVAKKFDLP